MRKILALFAVILAVSGVAMAMNNVSISSATDMTRWAGNVSGNSDTTQGGNITALTLGESRLTDRWAGYYGNVSATILLRDNTSSAYLYIWSANSSNVSGELCASTNPSFNFAGAVTTTAAAIDAAWGFLGGLDLATNTFNDGACNLTFAQDSRNVTNTIRADEDSGASAFASCAIASTATPSAKNDFAFCTNALGVGNNFKGESVNFEFMVATNETLGSTELYYFFMELGA